MCIRDRHGIQPGLLNRVGVEFQTLNIKTSLGQGQGNGSDAAIGVDHPCAGALSRKPVCEALNAPFRLRRIHLNKGGAAEGELDSAELFLNGGNTGEAMVVRPSTWLLALG